MNQMIITKMRINKNNFENWAISEQLYNWIIKNIPKKSTILELGSGTGSIELAKLYNLYSVEHDKKWLNLTKKSNYIYAPIKNGWYDIDILKKKLPKEYDLILVDGPPGNIGREGFLKNLKLFNTNVPIIIDDSNRLNESIIFEELVSKLGRKNKRFLDKNKEFGIIY